MMGLSGAETGSFVNVFSQTFKAPIGIFGALCKAKHSDIHLIDLFSLPVLVMKGVVSL